MTLTNVITKRCLSTANRSIYCSAFVLSNKIQNSGSFYQNYGFRRNSQFTANDKNEFGANRHLRNFCLALLLGGTGTYAYYKYKRNDQVYAFGKDNVLKIEDVHKTSLSNLPTYRMEDVSKHDSLEKGVWVTYGIGVYDITKFVPEHPGSDKVMLAAGGAIDSFWHIFQQHNNPEVLKLLETFRIGNLAPEDDVGTKDLSDPWANEPNRPAFLVARSKRPFNAEPPLNILSEHFLTPIDFFYVRNHLPVPVINLEDYELEIEIENSDKTLALTFEDIKKLPKHDITATVMCAGNRRSEMAEVKPVKGLSWGAAAVGNAVWSGPKLCDILKNMGVESDELRHVHFEGLDTDPTSTPYAASIPLAKAMDPRGDVILAYEMNGQPLPRDHGYPLRVIVPGIAGARNVKWLGRIYVSKSESNSHWQQNDYKGFSPSTDWDTVDFSKSPPIQHMPVISAVCAPISLEKVKINSNGCIPVKGYAWSGGGNKIVRVDVTTDGGKTWHAANLQNESNKSDYSSSERHWSWALWKIDVPVEKGAKQAEIWVKAVDSNYNVQPETFDNIWNLRGVLNNAYHRVKVNLI